MRHPILPEPYRLALMDGREIELATYHQQPTYQGLLLGYPTRSMNRRIIQKAHLGMAKVVGKRRLSIPLRPILLDPAIAPIAHPESLEEDPLNPYEALPPIVSVSVLDSDAVGKSDACSSALVVWYQHQWGLPTAPILEKLRKLDWPACSRDWTW